MRLVRWVIPMPNTCWVRMWSTRSWMSGISSFKPSVRREVISRRNTPDLVNGSRNLRSLFAQMLAPSFATAYASATRLSISLANAGGVNTSSFERFAMQVRTSGFRLRRLNATCSLTRGTSSRDVRQGQGAVVPGRQEDLVLAQVGEEGVLLAEGRHLGHRVEPEVTTMEASLAEVGPLREGDWLWWRRHGRHGKCVPMNDIGGQHISRGSEQLLTHTATEVGGEHFQEVRAALGDIVSEQLDAVDGH